MNNTCCVAGHRKIANEKVAYVYQKLKEEVGLAVEHGYTNFISGFAEGTDLIFAEIVAKTKQNHPNIKLIAAIPYYNRLKTSNRKFQGLISQCDVVQIVSQNYFGNCFLLRNRWMVQRSDLVIAVYDGRERSGTQFTIHYAFALNRNVKLIVI